MFFTASGEEIRSGLVTDVYFKRTKEILETKGIDKLVRMEARLKSFPGEGKWGILSGIHEVMQLLERKPLNVWALPEGSLFHAYEPVLVLESMYREFSILETPLLGFLCQASGVSTRAAKCVIAAQGRPIYSFGVRRMHPAIAPMISRSAFIGGCTGVASVKGAAMIGEEPVGTIPHALILILEDSTTATTMFNEVIDKNVKRVALVDTFGDEKFEALENANLLGEDLYAVRLDTPSSRRGDMKEIAREVRWELDINGYNNIKIFISGGLNEKVIPELNEVADAYGVGTAISNAPVLDFALDIVEIEGEPVSKRGKRSSSKQIYQCKSCRHRETIPWQSEIERCSKCGGDVEPQLVKFLDNGDLVRELPKPQKIREKVLENLPKEL